MKKTLIHIYTGDGKGKTTAATGLATRALAHGMKICYASFHKNPDKQGPTEVKILGKLGATIHVFAKEHSLFNKAASKEEISLQVLEGLKLLEKEIKTGKFDLLILDEVIISVRDGYLPEENLLQFMKNKPDNLELVMTGRGATPRIIEQADYVSNICKTKHPFDKNMPAREGIEY